MTSLKPPLYPSEDVSFSETTTFLSVKKSPKWALKGMTMTLQELAQQYGIKNERQVLITEVTRMSGGLVCVAGIDLHSRTMTRPLQTDGSNWEENDWVETGFMEVGNVVSLKPANAGNPAYPHATEDHRVSHVTLLGQAAAKVLHAACAETADADVDSIFGGHLQEGKYVVADTQCRSLGCVLIEAGRLRAAEFYGKPQVSFQDNWGIWHNFTVTELFAKKAGDAHAGAASLKQRIGSVNPLQPIALRLGLARAWDGGDQAFDPKRCYLQLNGLVLPS